MTPHINAKKEDIAKTVLMPGDPLRAQFIANNFLKNVKIVNKIRNMFMYTGLYNGKKITIAASGMGQPSIGIYSYELFRFYDVDNIIRIGSAGSYKKDLKLYEVVLAKSAYTDSTSFSEIALGKKENISLPSRKLNNKIKKIAKNQNIYLNIGQIHSSNVFYAKRNLKETIKKTKSICVEMEATALFTNAKITGKNAACLLTISDNLITKEEISPEERQNSFIKMIKIALELA